MAGMEGGALRPCPSSKSKVPVAAALEEGFSDGGSAAVYATAPAETVSDGAMSGAPAPAELEAAQLQEAPRRAEAVMSREWIDSVLADEIKPLPFTERHLKNPVLADAFRSHKQTRAKFAEYQDRLRRECETKGYVEVDEDYEERCKLLQALTAAALYGREGGGGEGGLG